MFSVPRAGGVENVDPNTQTMLGSSRIPSPLKKSSVRASPLVLASRKAAVHDAPHPLHPHVSAASTARPSRVPSPPERAPPSASTGHLNAQVVPQHPLPVTADKLPARVDTLPSAQPTAGPKPFSVLSSRCTLPNGSANLPAPASGATANHEGTSTTAQAAACTARAPLQARTSAQTNMTATNPSIGKAVSKSLSGSPPDAAACGAPAAYCPQVSAVPSTTPAVSAFASQLPAPSAQPVARHTRAASRQQMLPSAKPSAKPHSSAMPQTVSLSDCESDSSSDDDTDPPKDRAAAFSQRPREMCAGSPKTAPVMLANPLYTRRCSLSQPNTGELTYTTSSSR